MFLLVAMRTLTADYAVARCPSVCHTSVLDSRIILVSPHETVRQYSDGDSPECRRGIKNRGYPER